jgi:hypothetical protein
MTHSDIMRAAARLVDDAEQQYPHDRVKQCVHIIGRRGALHDAFEQAERDVAFDRIFRLMTDEEAQVWAVYCLYDEVPAISRGMAWRTVKQPSAVPLERAA